LPAGKGLVMSTDTEPRLPVQAILSFGSLILLAFGAMWTLMQTQFMAVDKEIDLSNKAVAELVRINRISLEGLSNDIHNELRHDVVGQPEFKQFSDRLDSILKRLDIVEATRPTTGELKGTADGLDRSVQVLVARVIQLEQKLYDLSSKAAHNPVESGELNVTINGMNSRLDLVQQQIADINRQIAATLLNIDANSRRLQPQGK
jgi:hypothetical protein